MHDVMESEMELLKIKIMIILLQRRYNIAYETEIMISSQLKFTSLLIQIIILLWIAAQSIVIPNLITSFSYFEITLPTAMHANATLRTDGTQTECCSRWDEIPKG